jgi:zinc transport system substrate-binding protein
LAGRPLLGSHPVYQYLARRYGLSLVELHWEPEVVPDEAALGDLKEILAEHPAAVMLWEGEELDAASVIDWKKVDDRIKEMAAGGKIDP